jgi:hypothetical protein
MLTRNEGGPADWPEAIRLLEAAGAAGHAGALRELAITHDEGRGSLARDPVKGAGYFLAYERARLKTPRSDAESRAEFWSLALRREVQRILADAGLYKGPRHGFLTRDVRRAIEAYATRS